MGAIVMADGSGNDRPLRPRSLEANDLLAPLNRQSHNWVACYQVYLELPPGERQVLDLLLGRLEPKQVARQLGVSWNTIRNQIQSLRTKFAADSVQELVLIVAITLYETAILGNLSAIQDRSNDERPK